MIKIRRYIFLFLGIVLAFSTMCYARYVISKSVELGLNVNANVETGIIDFEISTDKNIYVVKSTKEAFALVKSLSSGKETYCLIENDLPDIYNE